MLVGLGVLVSFGVLVGMGVLVRVGTGIGVPVGIELGVGVGIGVLLSVGMAVPVVGRVAVRVGVGVREGVDVGVRAKVDDGRGVAVFPLMMMGVGERVAPVMGIQSVGVAVSVGVLEAVRVKMKGKVGSAVRVGAPVRVAVGKLVGVKKSAAKASRVNWRSGGTAVSVNTRVTTTISGRVSTRPQPSMNGSPNAKMHMTNMVNTITTPCTLFVPEFDFIVTYIVQRESPFMTMDARDGGVEATGYRGARTRSSRLSTRSPARAHVPTIANRITKSWVPVERMAKSLCQIFETWSILI